MGLDGFGKVVIGGAVLLLVLGGLLFLLGRFGVDRLPGDLVFSISAGQLVSISARTIADVLNC